MPYMPADDQSTNGVVDPDAQDLSPIMEEVTRLLASTELELAAKGYPPKLAQLAVSRAEGYARVQTNAINPSIRPAAYRDVLRHHLGKAEEWARRTKSALDEVGAPTEEDQM